MLVRTNLIVSGNYVNKEMATEGRMTPAQWSRRELPAVTESSIYSYHNLNLIWLVRVTGFAIQVPRTEQPLFGYLLKYPLSVCMVNLYIRFSTMI